MVRQGDLPERDAAPKNRPIRNCRWWRGYQIERLEDWQVLTYEHSGMVMDTEKTRLMGVGRDKGRTSRRHQGINLPLLYQEGRERQ